MFKLTLLFLLALFAISCSDDSGAVVKSDEEITNPTTDQEETETDDDKVSEEEEKETDTDEEKETEEDKETEETEDTEDTDGQDTTAPTIVFGSGNSIKVLLGAPMPTVDVTLSDNVTDAAYLQEKLTIDASEVENLATNELGIYTVTYTTSDEAGNATTETLTVTVYREGVTGVENWFLPYPKPSKYVSYGGDWTEQIKAEWEFYKVAMIDRFGIGLACRNNKDNNAYHAFSEGIAYGLIFSLYMGDEEYFQKVYDAAEKLMRLESGYYGWKYNVTTGGFESVGDQTSATDAEMEIAYALYSAAKLVEEGYWAYHTSGTEGYSQGQSYQERADEIMGLILNQDDEDGQTQVKYDVILPGDQKSWFADRLTEESKILYNPSYFMPGYIRELAKIENTEEWERVLVKGYEIQSNVEGNDKGLSPDWCGPDGAVFFSYLDYAQEEQYSMYLDAIRVPFRIGMDAVWFQDPSAVEYCNNTANFIDSWEKAGLYTLDGTLMHVEDQESAEFVGYINWMRGTLYDYYVGISSTEEQAMSSTGFYSLSMWLVAILGSDNEELKLEFAEKLKSTWVQEADIDVVSSGTMPRFGVVETWSGGANHYFMHSLTMFGALFAAGAFPNILDDLK